MKTLATVLTTILTTILSLILLMVATLTYLWWKPEAVINEKTVRNALKFAPPPLQVSWENLEIDFRTLDRRTKRASIQARNLCLRWKDQVDTCLRNVDLVFTLKLQDFRPKIVDIERATLDVEHLRFAPKAAGGARRGALPDLRLPVLPENLLTKFFDTSQPSQSIDLRLRNLQLGKYLSASLRGSLRFFPGENRLLWSGQVKGRGRNFDFQTPLTVSWGLTLRLEGKPHFSFAGYRYHSTMHLSWDQKKIFMELGPLLLSRLWAQGVFDVQLCKVTTLLSEDQGFPLQNALTCDVRVFLHQTNPLLTSARLRLQSELKLAPKSFENLSAELFASVSSEEKLLRGQVEATARFEWSRAQRKFLAAPQAELSATLTVPDVQLWQKALLTSRLAIPAPFYTLKGPIHLEAKSEPQNHADDFRLRAELRTHLQDQAQRLRTRTTADLIVKGQLFAPEALEIDITTLLQDVHLEAPPLQLGRLPQFFPDRRFVLQRPVKLKPARVPLIWQWTLLTEKPARVTSNLLQQPLPVTFSLRLRPGNPPEGSLTVLKTPFEMFRKKAELDFLQLIFAPGARTPQVSGLVTYENPEVQVRAYVMGNTRRPRLDFQSEPPLSRQQIISVLLYNKSLAELTEDELSSAGSFNRALSDSAFGLFSLFFLSRTPIQSIHYNPASQTYNATLALDKNTTFSIGSDFSDSRQYSLRRRLRGHWALTTELTQEEDQGSSVSTLIEWFRRYE